MKNQPTPETTEMTAEAYVKSLEEMITVREKQVRLAELNTAIAVLHLQETEAIVKTSYLKNPQSKNASTVKHVVTQDDLDHNPELSKDGVQVGDEILIPG